MALQIHCPKKKLCMNVLLRGIHRASSASIPPPISSPSSCLARLPSPQFPQISPFCQPLLKPTFLPRPSLPSLRFSASLATPHTPPESVLITDSCVKRLQQLKQEEGGKAEEKMLRVTVEGGGCSGFQYIFTLVDKFSTSDRIFEKDGVKVVVDDISLGFIKGATIDYVEELIRSAFMVTQNPNASSGCGCGSSFTVK